MPAAGINSLVALVAASPSQNTGNAILGGMEDGTPGNQFSQLLGDSNAQFQNQPDTQTAAAGNKFGQSTSASILSAQELHVPPADSVEQLLAQVARWSQERMPRR